MLGNMPSAVHSWQPSCETCQRKYPLQRVCVLDACILGFVITDVTHCGYWLQAYLTHPGGFGTLIALNFAEMGQDATNSGQQLAWPEDTGQPCTTSPSIVFWSPAAMTTI